MQEHGHEYLEQVLHIPSPIERRLGVWPLRAGQNIAKPHYKAGPKLLDYHSVHMVLEGQLWLKAGSRRYELREGDLFCMYPHERYEYGIASSESRLRLCWLAIDGVHAAHIVGQSAFTVGLPVIRGRGGRTGAELYAVFARLFAGLRQAGQAGSFANVSLVLALFDLLTPQSREQPGPAGKEPDWLERSAKFIQIHYKENISVNQVADWAGVSRAHFSKYFTMHKGVSPSKFMEQLRMDEAQQLLTGTDLLITEIALSLGYADLYSFTRAFKQRFGRPPTAWRKG